MQRAYRGGLIARDSSKSSAFVPQDTPLGCVLTKATVLILPSNENGDLLLSLEQHGKLTSLNSTPTVFQSIE